MLDQKLPKKRDKIFFIQKKQTMDIIIFNAIFGFKRPKTSCAIAHADQLKNEAVRQHLVCS